MDKSLDQITSMVSVVMSVYNGEKYLREAIDSVLTQTFSNFEFVIINDGSKDNSLSIIQSYADDRIVLINNDGNKGLIYSLNKGIEASKGKYIARMDADDMCLPERLKKQVEFLESHPNIGVVGSDYISFSENHSHPIRAIHKGDAIKTHLLFSATICHPTLMLRKQVMIDHHLQYSETARHVEDYDLWCRLAMYTDFFNLSEVLFKYRDHSAQVSHQNRETQLLNSRIIQENYLRNLGFEYNEQKLITHFLIASNSRIQSKDNVKAIEQWLLSLIAQNVTKNIIPATDFNSVIGKIWKDCCGNTKLGLWSYFFYQRSVLRKISNDNETLNAKLLAKCLIRWLK